jgi:hypothetical protein
MMSKQDENKKKDDSYYQEKFFVGLDSAKILNCLVATLTTLCIIIAAGQTLSRTTTFVIISPIPFAFLLITDHAVGAQIGN